MKAFSITIKLLDFLILFILTVVNIKLFGAGNHGNDDKVEAVSDWFRLTIDKLKELICILDEPPMTVKLNVEFVWSSSINPTAETVHSFPLAAF